MKKISDYKTSHKNIQIYRPRHISMHKEHYYYKDHWIGHMSLHSHRAPDNIRDICNKSAMEDISTISFIKDFKTPHDGMTFLTADNYKLSIMAEEIDKMTQF